MKKILPLVGILLSGLLMLIAGPYASWFNHKASAGLIIITWLISLVGLLICIVSCFLLVLHIFKMMRENSAHPKCICIKGEMIARIGIIMAFAITVDCILCDQIVRQLPLIIIFGIISIFLVIIGFREHQREKEASTFH